uniref:F-box associated beta-propeller type 1 domain-containing protein n=3 Tax=Daucus carota subsp. sativus TaxID=79200 RepID=A0A165Z622_DAUCS|nr:PREDICTED: F-box protein CPR30-like [Daucus carota subsp. sativus]
MVRLDNRISSERNYSNDFCIIFGSCRGLVCLESSGSISLWNPSIRKSLIISAKPRNYVLGFGVCNVTNDHKVVKLVYKQNISSRCMVQPEVEIYSLSTRSWRSVSDPAPSNHLVRDFWGYQCFAFGSVHWIASDVNREGDKYNLVVSFDMSKEVFNKLMFPNSIANYTRKLSITVLGDSLAALEFMNWKRGQRSYCVSVMKEYGVSESWTKLFTVKIPYWLENVTFREDGRIILPLNNNKLAFCDPESYDIKDLDNAGDFATYGIFTYTESLVLLKGRSSIPEGMPNLFAASAAKCS